MASIRAPAVAGTFYPGDAAGLDSAVSGYLAGVALDDAVGQPVPKAVIAPHAGYVYSGALAAEAYARLAPARDTIKRVVVIGPSHRMPFRGIAASGADAFATPAGQVAVDAAATRQLMALPSVVVLNEAHRLEHSLEVQLPFLQNVLGDFRVVPLVVGDAAAEQVTQVLDMLWGGPETLMVISSDLSHYLDYAAASAMDADTCKAIEAYEPDRITNPQACGRIPIKGLLATARARGLKVATLGVCNSGDTAGSKDRVVGYGAWAFFETEDSLRYVKPASQPASQRATSGRAILSAAQILERHGAALLRVALTSVIYGLKGGQPLKADVTKYPAALGASFASFVTLKLGGKLRGCIGTVQAAKPVVVDVADNAFGAAFKDHRFKPLTESELEALDIDISLLSNSQPMTIAGEADLLSQLRPGTDGLIISQGQHRALFLPSVWETLPKPTDFLSQLKIKAGLKADHWSDDFKAARFTTASISFADLKNAP
jgi:AmmeMemoRadiSam system protein B/AmmeMemoRadiSam system protein A